MIMTKRVKFNKIISIVWIVLIVFFCVAIFGIFSANPNSKKETVRIEKTLSGKYISFMGDSITTYRGVSNSKNYNSTIGNNAVFYPMGTVQNGNLTWWKKAVDNLDLELCVNNSWSGSCVTGTDSSSACMIRAQNLHNDKKNIYPDIIVIYMGINDYNGRATLGNFLGVNSIYNETSKKYIGDSNIFAHAYAMMVHKIKIAYPNADIYLCTLEQYNTTDIPLWNNVIKEIAGVFDCNIVDFYNDTPINATNLATYTIDGSLHPNEAGFTEMYKCLRASLEENYS